MTAQEIAREIEQARLEAGITTAELCRRAGVRYLSYWRAQDGQGSHYDTINALAEAAGYEIVIRKKEEMHVKPVAKMWIDAKTWEELSRRTDWGGHG